MPCPSGSFAYTIKPGDTFWKLAQRYNTTVEAIQAANPGVSSNSLRVGQVICIPHAATPPTPTTCPPGSISYTIKPGDTFWKLAQRYNTTVEAIQAANPGVSSNSLRVGQVICIPHAATPPTPTTCPPGSISYTIKPGDTFWKLAQRYNTTVEAIQAANPGVSSNSLRVGQVICIPSR